MTDNLSPRVNAARLPSFVGRVVRLPCKVLSLQPDSAVVEACDGGQVRVELSQTTQLEGTYVEIIGKVADNPELFIKLLRGLNLDSDKELDMKLVNDVIELTFDPRFKKMFPS